MGESLDTLVDLLTRREFLVGLACGLGALVVITLLGKSRGRAVGMWALATAAAILVGVHVLIEGRLFGLVAGVVLMALGGALTVSHRRTDPRRVVGWLLIVVGASLVPWRGQVDQSAWFFLATPVAAVIIGTALAHWRTDEQWWLGPLFAISAFGVWTTVPDTEFARVQLGAALPLSLATLRPASTRMAAAGAYALGGVFAWIPALDGAARPASIIGAWGSIGLICALPAARLLWRSRIVLEPWYVAGLHLLLVLVAARVIGLWTSAASALIAAVVLYGATIVVLLELDRSSRTPVTPSSGR